MNKKKACIESLAAQEKVSEPASKIRRYDDSNETIAADATNESACDTSGQHDRHISQNAASHLGNVGDATSANNVNNNGSAAGTGKMSHINNSLLTNEMQSNLKSSFQTSSDYFDDSTGVKLNCLPFRHCILPNFLTSGAYVRDLESSLLDLPLRSKNNDLYKFSQSRDLNHGKSSVISMFRSMCEQLRTFLSSITGIELNSKIDLFCSQYEYTDVLLCHDDELEERRIAFIYYLVPEMWSALDGGTLDLFDTDDNGQPRSIVKSIVPKRNSFLFFEVSAKSFHQVAEVLSQDKTRLSISGWFHGPPLSRPPPHVDSPLPAVPYGSIEESVFYSWFNPLYLAPEVQTDVRKRFEEDSEIELTDFLQEEKYNELVAALQEHSIRWNLLGPANKRNYYSADREILPPIVLEFLRVVQSDAVFLVLSNLTGLKLHPLAPIDDEPGAVNGNGTSSLNGGVGNPRCRSEVRKWEHGCYTLGHDTDTEILDFALDAVMYIGCNKDWSFDNGGYTSYIAKGEEEELLSVCPAANSLALVYRDKDTMRFVKHLNHRVTKLSPPGFFEINTVYYE